MRALRCWWDKYCDEALLRGAARYGSCSSHPTRTHAHTQVGGAAGPQAGPLRLGMLPVRDPQGHRLANLITKQVGIGSGL